jgi:hypothetical protein
MAQNRGRIRIEGHGDHPSRRADDPPDGFEESPVPQMNAVEIPDRDSEHGFLSFATSDGPGK